MLHEIVIESVRRPEKTGRLLAVYQEIVDNAVTWHCLEHESLTFKSSSDYRVHLRKIMIWLLTNPLEKYGTKDVVQCALEHGASAMFWRIVNTKSVFRNDVDEASSLIGSESGRENENRNERNRRNWAVFDVTNFTVRTFLRPRRGDVSERTSLLSTNPQDGGNGGGGGTVNRDCVRNERVPELARRNYDEPSAPDEPYLSCLLTAFDQWRSSNILRTQPIKELTQPYIKLAQRFRFVLGLVQLVFMLFFTAHYMPSKCSLAVMFNYSVAPCNSSSDHQHPADVGQQRSPLALLLLIWPIFLLATNVYVTIQHVKHVLAKQFAEKIVYKSKELRRLRSCFLTRPKSIEALLLNSLSTVFCFTLFAWLCIYFVSETYESYVEVTGMVLLFGWTANLDFFGSVTKNFSIFSLVVNKILVKDIPSFMLYFGFTVVGYSLAMHALRMLACTPNELVDETFFSVLSSAFGIGDFFEVCNQAN